MKFKTLIRNSLKTRVTLFTLLIFLVSIWSLAFYTGQMLHRDMQRELGEQQFSIAKMVAKEIDHELADRLQALEKVAGGFNQAFLENPLALQSNLAGRPVLQELFNGGLFVTGIDGVVMASVPRSADRSDLSYLDRDYVAGAIGEAKAMIGRPVIDRKLSFPVFGMAAPIRDAQGKAIGAVAGVINLGVPNFLGSLMANRYGYTGGYVLVSPKYRLVVAATDKSRIMETLPAPGINPMIDSHFRGDTKTVIGTISQDVQALTSMAPVPVAGWELVTTLPIAEAFAPIRAMQQRLLLATSLLTLLAGVLSWWMFKRQLAPMLAASKALAVASETNQTWRPLPVARQDEVGRLIGGFNHLLSELGKREALLTQILNTSSVAIFLVDLQGRITQANRRMAEMFGSSLEAMEGCEYVALVEPAGRDVARQNVLDLLAGAIPVVDLDRQYWRADHSLFWGHLSAARFIDADGHKQGLVGVIADITERKQMEEQVRQLAFYDTLTQLPNRRLFDDRLSQAIAASKRSACYGALMFLDLDNFKAINDTHGHRAGDWLLREVASRLKSCVREIDTVARLGGDEFVVVVADLSPDKAESMRQANVIAEKINTALTEPYRLVLNLDANGTRTIEHRCSASIGAVVFMDGEGSHEDFLKWADAAMYCAKAAGGSSIQFHAN